MIAAAGNLSKSTTRKRAGARIAIVADTKASNAAPLKTSQRS
jgi:hypothetical protein